jgi:hypothetical protein
MPDYFGLSEVRIPAGIKGVFLLQHVQTDFWVHAVSYKMGSGVYFFGGRAAGT